MLYERLQPNDVEQQSDYNIETIREERRRLGKSPRPATQKTLSRGSLSKYQKSDATMQTSVGKISYREWLKQKDSEKRLKKKLINQAQD